MVTAGDVIASWRATARVPTAVLARRLAERTTAVDDSDARHRAERRESQYVRRRGAGGGQADAAVPMA